MKKCSICGHLSTGVRRCPVCQTDVSALPDWNAVDAYVDDAPEERFKQCSCGQKNAADALTCAKCGGFLIRTAVQTLVQERPVLFLKSADGRRILVPGNGGMIGRRCLGETEFQNDPYISAKHIRITPKENGYRMEVLESTNGVRYNDRELEVGQEVLLTQGDRIRLGLTELTVYLTDPQANKQRIILK